VSKIIERVRKLLELAGNNPNENEAAAAIAKAHSILAEHNLSLETVEAYEPEDRDEAERGRLDTETNFSEKYYQTLWMGVADAHFCEMFLYRPNPRKRMTRYSLIGRKINTLVATQLAMYLCQTVRRLASEEARRYGDTSHAFKNAFIAGCCDRLWVRLKQMKKEAPVGATSNALVVLNDKEQERNRALIAEMGIKIRTIKTRDSNLDSNGYHRGLEAGDKVSFAQQLHNAAQDTRRIK
jgi:hypothetical protein